MRRKGTTIAVALALVAAAGAFHSLHGRTARPAFRTETISAGDVVRKVAATGTLQAVKTVEVGSQVSGTISQLGADFNSIVHKGQVLARLDPALINAEIASSRSALGKARADAAAAKVAVDDATVKLGQATALHDRRLMADADFDAAQVALRTAQANLASSLSQVQQAQAGLDQALVTRDHTVVTAPIDGIVIARNVDVGQTVAASFQAPTLFVLAADLTSMQINADIDESDIGVVRPGQSVRFTVDSYPQEEFTAVVNRIRLQPATVQNVVTYTVEMGVRNDDLRLKPGMTATLNIDVAHATDVVRVPATALRYVPQRDVFARLGQAVPKNLQEVSAAGRKAAAGGRRVGYVWVMDGSTLRPERVRLGLSDGSYAEVTGGEVRDGQEVVIGEATTASGPMASTPFQPSFGGRPIVNGR